MGMARFTAGLALLALLAPAAQAQPAPSAWVVDGQGRRFRVRFQPEHRLYAGVGAGREGGSVAPVLDLGLSLRAPPPRADAEVFWKRDHDLAHLALEPAAAGLRVEGRLYRGVLLRHSREGSLTIPTTPPLRLALPFDVGVRIELGKVAGSWLYTPGARLETELIRGEAMADLLRSEHPGRWLAVGAVGYYGVNFRRDPAGPLLRDHRVQPLTALALSAHGESERGLVTGLARAEWGRVWSSQRGWGQELRVEGALEVTPVAINDVPVSLVVSGGADLGAQIDAPGPRLRLFAGVRLGAPLPGP
jgi:hypothetical protein